MAKAQQSRIASPLHRTVPRFWDRKGRMCNPKPAFLSASVICGDPLDHLEELRMLEIGGIDMLHIDVMDGVFVPRIGHHPELVASLRGKTDLPIDVHLMLSNPEPYIPLFAQAGADIITIHAEVSTQLSRLLKLIRSHGVRPGIALNPDTSADILNYLIDEVDVVMLMAINPGSIGESMKPITLKKIVHVRKLIEEHGTQTHIMIDGNTNLENATRMVQSGATMLVSGTSSIYKQPQSLQASIALFKTSLKDKLEAV